MTDVTITHRDDGSDGTYFAHVAGSHSLGRLTWTKRDGVRIAEKTVVPTEIGGQGVAAQLVDFLVADAREQGFKVKPACSYVAAKFDQHPEWADIRA